MFPLGLAERKAASERARLETGYDPKAKSSTQALTTFSLLWLFGGMIVMVLGAVAGSDGVAFFGWALSAIGAGLLYLSMVIKQRREPLYRLYVQNLRRQLAPWRRRQLRLAAALFAVAVALGLLDVFVHSSPTFLARERAIFLALAIVTPIHPGQQTQRHALHRHDE